MKISIITVLLNPGRYLSQTIESVLRQSQCEIEYILIDGESTDGSVELIRSVAERDQRVILATAQPRGIPDAMNRGLAMARGDIVAFLHADDYYPDADTLAAVAEAFRTWPEYVWLTGGIREVDAEGLLIREVPVRRFSCRRLLRNNIILHPATFVRREAFERVGGFDDGLRYAMDYDLWLRLAAAYGPPIELARPLACFRVHRGSLSSRCEGEALTEAYRVRKRYLGGALSRMGHALYYSWQRFDAYRRKGSSL